MATPLETFRQLRDTYKFPSPSGFVDTPAPRIKLFWSTEKIDRTPMLPELGIVIMVSGRKTAYLDDRQVDYDEDNYLVVSAPVPFECASNATERDPLLGISVDIDLATLNRFAGIPGAAPLDAADALEEPTILPLGLQPTPVDAGLSDVSRRLVQTLFSPSDTQALGTSLADEIVYRALKGRQGPALLALTNQSSQHARIARAISRIRRNVAEPHTVEDLALEAGMSVRSFHRAFRAATALTPLRYVKVVRLNLAMNMLRSGLHEVGTVARRVGYESGSQFSREFKRQFSILPGDVREGRGS